MTKIKVASNLFDDVILTDNVRKRLWFLMSKKVDGILNDFYEILQDSIYSPLLVNVDIDSLRLRQKAHWEQVVLNPANDEHNARLKRMHEIHKRIGLPNRHYIIAYVYLLNQFEKVILSGTSGPKEAFALISALNSIFAEDISRALEFRS